MGKSPIVPVCLPRRDSALSCNGTPDEVVISTRLRAKANRAGSFFKRNRIIHTRKCFSTNIARSGDASLTHVSEFVEIFDRATGALSQGLVNLFQHNLATKRATFPTRWVSCYIQRIHESDVA
jgi:hypothetical protein